MRADRLAPEGCASTTARTPAVRPTRSIRTTSRPGHSLPTTGLCRTGKIPQDVEAEQAQGPAGQTASEGPAVQTASEGPAVQTASEGPAAPVAPGVGLGNRRELRQRGPGRPGRAPLAPRDVYARRSYAASKRPYS